MTEIINFDDPRQRRLALDYFRSLKGEKRVAVKNYRPRRSDRANRFYWVAVVHPFAEWLTENYGEEFDDEDAHHLLKKTFLTKKIRHPVTGKVVEKVGSSAALDDAAFAEYVGKCIHLLMSYCDIPHETFDATRALPAREPKLLAAAG